MEYTRKILVKIPVLVNKILIEIRCSILEPIRKKLSDEQVQFISQSGQL